MVLPSTLGLLLLLLLVAVMLLRSTAFFAVVLVTRAFETTHMLVAVSRCCSRTLRVSLYSFTTLARLK